MKKKIIKFKKFSTHIVKGLHTEFKETVAIPSLIKNGQYREAVGQVADIAKMGGLAIIWIVPGGAVITTVILKYYHKARPSAFHPKDKE